MTAISQVVGKGVPVLGNDIDTDRIIPARFLKEITFEKMGEYLFYDVRFDDAGNALEFPLNDSRFNAASIMVVGRNFGCGSSREHAAQAIKRYGFNALVGESFGEIFAGNCQSLGVPAVMLPAAELATLLSLIEQDPTVDLSLDLEANTLMAGDHSFTFSIDDARKQSFLSGSWDAVAMLKSNEAHIRQTASQLPYMTFRDAAV